jgi:hypothetical protein
MIGKLSAATTGCVVLAGLLGATVAHADCGYRHRSYPEGENICLAGAEFRCGEFGAWRKLPTTCKVDPNDKADVGQSGAGKPKDDQSSGRASGESK